VLRDFESVDSVIQLFPKKTGNVPVTQSKSMEEKIHVGEMIKARIITFDPEAKRIGLSLKALDPNYVPPAEVIVQ
jgi:predicted RNA-binding protein (virulence factor B family)